MKIKKGKYTTKEKVLRILFIIVSIPFVIFAGWCGYSMNNFSVERAELKKDYSEVNNIQYGLLSVDRWRDNITDIVCTQIDNFEFRGTQEDTLKVEINKVLNDLITKANEMLNEKQTSIGGKLKKFAFKTFVNVDKIRDRVPEFSQTIINQISKPRNKQKIKSLALDKLNEFANQTRDSLSMKEYFKLLAKHKTSNVGDFNKLITERSERLQEKCYNYTFMMIGVMLLFLLTWFLVRNIKVLHTPLFTMSVLLALAFLFTGITSPMIEIDARIKEINFMLIGENIQFHDQVLFYQSKSITDVVKILIETGKADSILVGILILVFSIIFPIFKLLSTKIHLLASEKWKNNRLIKFFAFKSGKWSMADVMVVAIFMAYIGFKGILDSQLGNMNADMNNQYVSSITTNKTSLQPGFILFIAFVLFGLILSVILNKISPNKNKKEIKTIE